MPTISNSSNFTILAKPVDTVATSIVVLPIPSGGLPATGQLIHPALGLLTFPHAPDEWINIDTDIIVPPSWGYEKTLGGAANTLHPSNIRDVVCTERWTSELSVPMSFMRSILNLWMNPPDPVADGYVVWSPAYTSSFSFHVVIKEVTAGGSEITLDYASRQGYVVGDFSISYRIIGRV